MSGGVDSSTAAFLLKDAGYEVVGVTLCFGIRDTPDSQVRCCGSQAVEDAKAVCRVLGVPHFVMDFSEILQKTVIQNFVEEYSRGRTPNPCVVCNRELKFGELLCRAQALGFDYLATGHYASLESRDGEFFLKKAKDPTKDQTYFLYALRREDLPKLLFPLGGYTKSEVRQIACQANLPVYDKDESQDICFIPDNDYKKFLSTKLSPLPGLIVDQKGIVLGKHKGICFYTVGQREGLRIRAKKPLYVLAIDSEKNQIVVGEKDALPAQGLLARSLHVLVTAIPEQLTAKIRYRHPEVQCTMRYSGQEVFVDFVEPQNAVAPGQSVVLFQGEIVIGGGVIEKAVRNLSVET